MELIKARDDLHVSENNVKFKEAELKAKDAAYRRQQQLRQLGLSSQADLEAAEFEAKGAEYDMQGYQALVESGQAEIHRIEIEIDQTRIRAPFSGAVVRRYIREGEAIGKSDKCFRVSQLSPLQVQFQIPESSARRPQRGASVEVSLVGDSNRPLSARIVKISPTVDPASDSYDVVAQLTGTRAFRFAPWHGCSRQLARHEQRPHADPSGFCRCASVPPACKSRAFSQRDCAARRCALICASASKPSPAKQATSSKFLKRIPTIATEPRSMSFLPSATALARPAEITEALNQRHPHEPLAESEVLDFLDGVEPAMWERSLGEKNLAVLERIRDERKGRIDQSSVLYISFKAWDPNKILDKMDPYLGWMFTTGFVFFSMGLFIICLYLLAGDWTRVQNDTRLCTLSRIRQPMTSGFSGS